MAQMSRPGLTLSQKKELWQRWKEGQSLSEIGRALGKHAGSIHGVIKVNGGVVPAARTRSVRVLALVEREEISRRLAQEESVRWIAVRLERARRRSAVRSTATAAAESTERCEPTTGPGEMRNVPRNAYWPRIRCCRRWSREAETGLVAGADFRICL